VALPLLIRLDQPDLASWLAHASIETRGRYLHALVPLAARLPSDPAARRAWATAVAAVAPLVPAGLRLPAGPAALGLTAPSTAAVQSDTARAALEVPAWVHLLTTLETVLATGRPDHIVLVHQLLAGASVPDAVPTDLFPAPLR
jgi:hypothetical protein